MPFIVLLMFVIACAMPAVAGEITTAAVIERMNQYRATAGLAPLSEDPRLARAADERMRDMEELSYWAHVAPDGRSPFDAVRLHYRYQSAGENLASGFETSEVLVESWMESKGHRDNIMSPLYQHCGVAIIDGATTGRATGRSVVVLFARPLEKQR